MWEIKCQQNKYGLTYKTAFRPTGWDGSVGHFDGYDTSFWLRYFNMAKFVWSGEIKQMKVGFMWIYVVYYMITYRI